MIPKRRVRQKMGVRESAKVSCPSHARWVRGFECLGLGKVATDGPLRGQAHQCWGRIEAGIASLGSDDDRSTAEKVADVYRAMTSAAPSSSGSGDYLTRTGHSR